MLKLTKVKYFKQRIRRCASKIKSTVKSEHVPLWFVNFKVDEEIIWLERFWIRKLKTLELNDIKMYCSSCAVLFILGTYLQSLLLLLKLCQLWNFIIQNRYDMKTFKHVKPFGITLKIVRFVVQQRPKIIM